MHLLKLTDQNSPNQGVDRWLRQRRSRHPVVLTVRTPSHQEGDVPEFTSRPVIDQQHGARDHCSQKRKKDRRQANQTQRNSS